MKLSDLSDVQWLDRLQRRRALEAEAHDRWWHYYDGDQPLWWVAKIIEEQSNRFPALTINWSRVIVDGLDERCSVEGFTLAGKDSGDEDLWNAWQANDLDEYQSENHVSSLVTGVSYMMIGESTDHPGEPIMTIEDPSSVTVEVDPLTRRPVAALKVWKSDTELIVEDRAMLLLPGRAITFALGKQTGQTQQPWMEQASEIETSPEVPVIPFVNRQRRRQGRSELIELKPIVDAANQTATNMMAAIEHHAVPRKWALGVNADSFTDAAGNPLPAWKIATGSIWANPFDPDNPEAKPQVGQFPASDLRNFTEAIQLLGRMASGLYGVPPMMFGFAIGDNPANADGIRAAEDRWVRRAERRQTSLGAAYERAMRLVLAIKGRDPKEAINLETRWRDASTPTRGAIVDAAVKSLQTGIADLRQARLDAGYSLTQIKAMEEREASTKRSPTPTPPGDEKPPVNSETEALSNDPAQPERSGSEAPTAPERPGNGIV